MENFDFGIKIISEMTRDELIEELLSFERKRLEDHPDEQLKIHIVELRTHMVRQRMIKEAGLREERGFMGMSQLRDENETDC